MTDAELWASWRLWMGVAALVIVIAAVLLIIIWRSTLPIWALETTNEVAGEILATVQQIEAKGGALAAALESHAGAR